MRLCRFLNVVITVKLADYGMGQWLVTMCYLK